jgi:hypothetical protein
MISVSANSEIKVINFLFRFGIRKKDYLLTPCMDITVKSIMFLSLKRVISSQQEELTVTLLFGKVHFASQKDRKLRKEGFVSQAIVLMREQRLKVN